MSPIIPDINTVFQNISNYKITDLYPFLGATETTPQNDLETNTITIIKLLDEEINKAGISATDKDKRIQQQNFFLDVYDFITQEKFKNNVLNKTTYVFKPPDNTLSTAYNVPSVTKIDDSKPIFVNPLDYTIGTLNPIQKQTIKRIISIDSQQRNTQFFNMSTEFTYDLSETLKDVLALRLYYYHIPGTWYTVANTYGSNFFFLKGNAPGIDIGNYDVSFEVQAGNYSAIDLVSAINSNVIKRIEDNNYPDISFGNTNLSYNTNTKICTMNLDIKLLLNEVNYKLEFKPLFFSYPENTETRFNFINSFLGYNFQNYQIGDVYSQFTVNDFDDTVDTGTSSFRLTDVNRYIYIIQTTHQEYTAGISEATIDTIIEENDPKKVIQKINITTNISNVKYSRNVLIADLSLALHNYNNSTITRTKVTNQNQLGYNRTYFNIHINQDNVLNIPDIKYLLVFPKETNEDSPDSRIWCPSDGLSCCFQFKNRVNNISDVIAETDSPQSNYVVVSEPYILLSCIRDGYIREENNYKIIVPSTNLTATKNYTLEQYITAINTSIITLNTNNNNNLFNIGKTKVICDNTTENIVHFQFDIQKKFTTDKYYFVFYDIDFDSYLHSTLGIDYDIVTKQFTSTLTSFRSTYAIPSNNNILVKIYPIPGIDNHNDEADPFIVYTTDYQAKSRPQFIGFINEVFQNFSDYEGSKPLSDTNFNIEIQGTQINATINIAVNKILSESDYNVSFVDPSSNGLWNINNSWKNYFKLENYTNNLSDYHVTNDTYALIQGVSKVFGFGANFEFNQQITIKAVGNGVATNSNANDIIINIPAGPYTRTEILNIMNTQLSLRKETKDSEFVVETDIVTNKQYVIFRSNINKIFTAKDYRAVFYDNVSFLNCNNRGSAKQTSWNSTIGYLLGFTAQTQYDLFDETNTITFQSDNTVTIKGDTVVSTYIFQKIMIILEDYNQSRINDGLVTSTPQQNRISYNSRPSKNPDLICDPITKLPLFQSEKEISASRTYAENKKLESNLINITNTQSTPYIKDIFGVIPTNPEKANLVEFGGTLQNQERIYFGPVNIRRLSIKLIDDRGELLDLNGAEWSFAFVCEQLYSAKTNPSKK